ncbi:VOC family protein [Dactylosporangium sp. NPDC051541]|uniref:VOC family protein n=1 Tax=Dactylosporangium sp. NPDC051541 TaxID=3363977 RepID=UPI0037BA41F4
MSHKSRLFAVIIDVAAEERDAATRFWAAALGADAAVEAHEPQFTSLAGGIIKAALQQIEGDARYHLDFETDDLDAEVARLRGLGAVPVSRYLDCHVLRAPGGHLLCVIPVHGDRADFDATARVWD